jgi:septum formation protein
MLAQKLNKYNVILASGSPRRQNFFQQLEIPFTIDVREVDEVYPDHLQGAEITDYLADLKSKAFTDLKENDLLVTSDTIVWFEGKAIGKPKDKEDAFKMLKSMSGKKHQVFTSVSIKGTNFQKIFHEETTVEFDDLSDEEIHYYLETYEPYDKAGSYGIQDWIGLIGVTNLEGSYFNVMGLPVHKLYKELLAIAV